MNNEQNSSNNQGVGDVGNNINIQQEKGIRFQVLPNKSDRDFGKEINSLYDKIGKLEKSIKDLKNIKNFFSKCINYWILGILIVLLGIDIALHISYKVITSDHIVLTFVGVLATFIVVSNYAQVQETKREFLDKVSGFQIQLQNIRDEFESHYIRRSDVPDVKVLEYKMEMLHSLNEGYIVYHNENFKSYLALSMKALYYYNTINAILPYRLDGIVLFIKHLSDNTITISESEKESYLGIAYNYKGYEKDQLIQFIQNLQTS
jgi:hypothetical protein